MMCVMIRNVLLPFLAIIACLEKKKKSPKKHLERVVVMTMRTVPEGERGEGMI